MANWRLRRRLVAAAALLLAATCVTGCGGRGTTYRGRPVAFSTHFYRMWLPPAFMPVTVQQMNVESPTLVSFTEDVLAKAKDLYSAKAPARIYVRCFRMRRGETLERFMERFHDELAAIYMEFDLRRIRKPRSGHPEYELVTSGSNRFVARLIVLPRDRLAYDVETMCPPDKLAVLDEPLRRTRESFTILGVRR